MLISAYPYTKSATATYAATKTVESAFPTQLYIGATTTTTAVFKPNSI